MLVYTSEGTALGPYPVVDGRVTLRSGSESVVWGESGRRLHEACDRIEALKSRKIHFDGLDGIPRMSNGEEVTDEIMEYWGWRRDGDKWVICRRERS